MLWTRVGSLWRCPSRWYIPTYDTGETKSQSECLLVPLQEGHTASRSQGRSQGFGFSWVLLGSRRVVLGSLVFSLVLLGSLWFLSDSLGSKPDTHRRRHLGFSWVLLGSRQVILGCLGLSWVLLCSLVFSWVLLSSLGFSWVLSGRNPTPVVGHCF